MEEITTNQFNELVEKSAPVSVSLYVPTDPLNPDPRTNLTAFKNQINTTLASMKALKLTDQTFETLDAACEDLLEDEVFWKEQKSSFALFAAGSWSSFFTLATPQSELTMMSDHLYILPFIPSLKIPKTFYILELDKENTRMWKGTPQGLKNVDVPNLAKSITEVTGTEMNERGLQFHTGTDSPKGDMRAAAFHGSSSWKDDKDRYLKRFLQTVDKAVVDFFKNTKNILFMSGTEELTVMYGQLSKCHCLEKSALSKVDDPSHRKEKLHQQASAMLASALEEQRAIAVTAFEEQPHQNRKVLILPEILKQAVQGRVEHLLINEEARVWGTFSPDTFTTVIADTQQPMSTELLNLAARLTLQTGGEVTLLPAEQMPNTSDAVALLRY